jgi:large subunit ribosomal protein L12
MEYIYAAMLLHKAEQEINEANVKSVLEAAKVKVDDARVKALIASLDGVDIAETIKNAAAAPVAAAPVAAASDNASKEEEKKEDKEDDKKADENAAAGLGALFG